MLEDARVITCAITREVDSNCVRRAPLRVQGRNQVRVFTSHGTVAAENWNAQGGGAMVVMGSFLSFIFQVYLSSVINME